MQSYGGPDRSDQTRTFEIGRLKITETTSPQFSFQVSSDERDRLTRQTDAHALSLLMNEGSGSGRQAEHHDTPEMLNAIRLRRRVWSSGDAQERLAHRNRDREVVPESRQESR